MSNFIYPRTISVTRASFASTPTDGLNQSETTIVASVAASIQLKRNRAQTAAAYQGGTNSDDAMPTWKIFTAPGAIPLGTIRKGDKIKDDLNVVYEVEAPYWNSLGYSIEARVYNP